MKRKKLRDVLARMDAVESLIDKNSHLVNSRDYHIMQFLADILINGNPWSPMKNPHKLGVFKKVKPRVK